MGSFSIWHWLIVLVIVLLIFGTKKLKNIGGDLGGAVKGFKEGMKDAGGEAVPPPGQIVQPESKGQTAQGHTIEGEVKEKTKS